MSLSLYDPFEDFNTFFNAFNAWNTNSGQRNQRGIESGSPESQVTCRPRVDVHEDPKKNVVTVTAELPGMRREDVTIDVCDGRLSITGQASGTRDLDLEGYVLRERRYGKFVRSFPLPRGIKAEQVTAAMKDGILTVVFPKMTEEQQARRVPVN